MSMRLCRGDYDNTCECGCQEKSLSNSDDAAGYKPEYEYAKRLAIYIWEKHYKEEVPEWEPLDDLMGVLSQIDNMLVGL